ncbi:MAG: alanine racemase [Lactobacillaceae bacterium]|jgi:alanine racemase|nr:alanine racemase [Lactobacillaceae bacterium]
MRESQHRPTSLTVDLSAVVHNAQELIKWTKAKNIIAVLKADAYGMGAVPVAKELIKNNLTNKIAVSNLDEALDLKENGIQIPIWVFGAHDFSYLNEFIENDFEITVGNLEWLEQIPHLNGKLKVQLAIDTGMTRIGFNKVEDIKKGIKIIEENNNLELTGIYTHFATADSADNFYFKQQVKNWHILTDELNLPDQLKSVANSPTSIWHRDEDLPFYNLRIGAGLYGFDPSDEQLVIPSELKLIPASKFATALSDVRFVKKGISISYGATYTTNEDSFIGTIPLGYRDGWLRRMQGTDVLIDGKFMPIVGRVTMDYILIKLDKKYEVGTPVILFNDAKTLTKLAKQVGTIGYELITSLNYRVKREYIGGQNG